MKTPTTGVYAVMPTFNQADLLLDAICAVAQQVDHLVIVNDGSTDNTPDVMEKVDGMPGIGLMHLHPNMGTAVAINAGVDLIRKEFDPNWLTWVSSDNVVYEDWIETELGVAAQHAAGAVYSAMDVHYLPGVRRRKADHISFRPYHRKWLHEAPAAYFGCSFIIRDDVWPMHRGRMGHDFDHWMRVEEQCWMKGLTIIGVERPLARYQVHNGQATLRGRGPEKDARLWWREGLVRRKQMGVEP